MAETKVADYTKQVYVGSGAGNLSRAHAAVPASTAIVATNYAVIMTIPAGATIHATEIVCSASLGAAATLTLRRRPASEAGSVTNAVSLTAAVAIDATSPVRTAIVPYKCAVDTDIVGLVGTADLGVGGTTGIANVMVDYVYTGV